MKLIQSIVLTIAVLISAAPAISDDGFFVIPVASMTFRGNWDVNADYNARDVVFYNGSSWFSLVGGNRGNTPDTSSAQWMILAQKGDRGPQGLPGSGGIKVYDNNSQFIGYLVKMDNNYYGVDTITVFVPSLNKFTSLFPNDGMASYSINPWDVFYPNNGCLGSPLINYGSEWLLAGKGSYYTGGSLVYAIPPGSSVGSFSSRWNLSGCEACPGCSFSNMSSGFNQVAVYQAVEVPAASLPFTPPFAAPLRFEMN